MLSMLHSRFSAGINMFSVMVQMAGLIAIGIAWQQLAPKEIPIATRRRAMTDLVFYILLPALVLDVMWRAPLDITTLKLSVTAISAIAVSLMLMWVATQCLNITRAQRGALLIAGTFPNSTYLGLPVTAQAFGDWSQPIVLQYDLFACTPLVLTLGILIAHHFGDNNSEIHPFKALLKVPPLWALGIALLLDLMHVPQPNAIHQALALLGGGVVPLMLIALGLSIRWHTLKWQYLPLLLPVCIIALLIAPFIALFVGDALKLSSETLNIATILAAMPTMIFGIVLCERFQLDSELYASAVFLTTAISIVSLTLLFSVLTYTVL